MRVVIILVMKKSRIGDICILNMWVVRNQALNLRHQLLMLKTSSSISIIKLPTVPHHYPRPHLYTLTWHLCHLALLHLMSTVWCPSFHPPINNIIVPLLHIWPPNKQFQKYNINNTTCTSKEHHHRLLYIPHPVQQYYLTQLQLPSIVMSLICQHRNHYTTTTLTSKLNQPIHMVLLSHIMQWQELHRNINLALTLGLVETRDLPLRIQLDPPEVLQDPQPL